MVNVTDKFVEVMKDQIKSKGLNPADFVLCIFIKEQNNQRELQFLLMPLQDFEVTDTPKKNKIPFQQFLMIKRLGLWIVSDTAYFLAGVNSRLDVDEEGGLKIERLELKDLHSEKGFVFFLGKCLMEYMKNEKMTRKELCENLKISNYKLNRIISGKQDVCLDTMVKISLEMQGRNKELKYFVMVEKYIDPSKRKKRIDYLDEFD